MRDEPTYDREKASRSRTAFGGKKSLCPIVLVQFKNQNLIIQREVVTGVLNLSRLGGGARHERVARADE